MEFSNEMQNDMIKQVSKKLMQSTLLTSQPELIAKNLLSHYNYDLKKVLDLAV